MVSNAVKPVIGEDKKIKEKKFLFADDGTIKCAMLLVLSGSSQQTIKSFPTQKGQIVLTRLFVLKRTKKNDVMKLQM